MKLTGQIKILSVFLATVLIASCAKLGSNQSDTNQAATNPVAAATVVATTTPDTSSFTIVTTGDILLHERLWSQAQKDGKDGQWNFFPQLAGISAITNSADLALCHLETPIANKSENYSGYPVFNSPPEILTAVKELGFDMCDQTSNHSLDKGFAGIERTLNKLDELGIPHTGTARSAEEAARPLVIDIKQGKKIFRVGIIAYTYGFNGFTRPADKLWSANQIDVQQMIEEANAARAAGAQFVIAKIHWGTEYTNKPNSAQIKLATELAESGAIDLIDGAHSHSVQPVTKIKNMWVAYSHGNLIAAHREPTTIKSEGLVVRWTVSENSDGKLVISKVEQIPTLITDNFPVRVLNIAKSLNERDFTIATEERMQQALNRSAKVVTSFGDEIPVAN